jgi:hypothetical protein
VATLPDDEKEVFVKDVEAIVQEAKGMVWIDQKYFQYPHRTDVVVSKRM